MNENLTLLIDEYISPQMAYHYVRSELEHNARGLLHNHDFYEMTLIERGKVLHEINGHEEILTTGDVVFIRPNDLHAMSAYDAVRTSIISLKFRCSTADHLVERYAKDLQDRFFWTKAEYPTRIYLQGAQFERAVNTCMTLENIQCTDLRIEHFLMTMMTFVLDDVARISQAAPSWLIRACDASQNPQVFIRGAAGFIEVAGRGHEHVSRQTRKYLGITPTEYTNRLRIQHSAMLLSKSTISVLQIAQECGFENASYFHRLFKQQYGCTPAQYRRRHTIN